MRFVELDDKKQIRFILPAELADDYEILPPNSIEIPLNSTVTIGMVYDSGEFREKTSGEIIAEYRPKFIAERSRLFSETAWIRERHSDRIELDIDDSENWTAWLNYWQALRNMPESEGFNIENPVYPESPE